MSESRFEATGYQQAFGVRTALAVPLLREGTTIGTFTLTRVSVNPFTDKQMELVTTFADQAVIAIENARLLSELRQRTTDLSQSLEQQTATSEILSLVLSSSGFGKSDGIRSKPRSPSSAARWISRARNAFEKGRSICTVD